MTFPNKGMAKSHPRFVALNPSMIFTAMKPLLSTPPHGNLSLPEKGPLGRGTAFWESSRNKLLSFCLLYSSQSTKKISIDSNKLSFHLKMRGKKTIIKDTEV